MSESLDISNAKNKSRETYRQDLQAAIAKLVVSLAEWSPEHLQTYERDDQDDTIYMLIKEDAVLRVRVECDWLVYDPREYENGDTHNG